MMFKHSLHNLKHNKIIFLLGAVIALGFWLGEGMLHLFIFDRQGIADVLLPSNIHELWMRSLVMFTIIGFSIYVQLTINKLHENKEQYRALFDSAPDAIFLADVESGEILDANPTASRLLLRPREEIIGLHQSQLHPPTMESDSTRLFTEHIEKVRQEENMPLVEHIALRSDGTEVPVEIAAQIVSIKGKPTLQGIFRDLTERKKVQLELEHSNKLLTTVMDSLDALVYVSDMDTHEILFINKYGRDIWGDIAGETFWKTLQFESAGSCEFCTNDKLISKDGEPTGVYKWECQNLTNGQWYDCHDQAIYWTDGRLVRMEIATNITDRKEAEGALRKSEMTLKESQEIANFGSWSMDLVTNEEIWSDHIYRLLDLKPEESKPCFESFIGAVHPDDREIIKEAIQKSITDKESCETEFRVIWKDGTERWMHSQGKVQIDEAGNPIKLVGIGQDITERKKAAEAIRESEEKYRHLFSTESDAIMVFDAQTLQTIDINEAGLELYGYSKEEFLKLKIQDISAEVEKTIETIKQLRDSGQGNIPLRYHKKKDGTVFPVEIAPGTFTLKNRKVLCGIVRDITERKKAEEALRRQSELLDSIRSAQSLFITGNDPKPVFEALLKTLVEITDSEYGFLDEVVRDENGRLYKRSLAISDISWNEESSKLYEQLKTSNLEFRNLSNLASAPAATGELVISNDPAGDSRSGGVPEGHPPIRAFMGIPMFFGGELVGVAGVANRDGGYNEEIASFLDTFISTCASIIQAVRDDRQKQQIAKELTESEEKYRRVVEDQTEFVARWLPDGTRTFVNDSYCRYYGISQDEAIGTSFFSHTTEDFREAIIRKIESVRPENPVWTSENKTIRPDGTIGWNQWTDRAIFDEEGKLIEFQSVGRDITERKRAEAALRASEDMFKGLAEQSITGISIIQDGRLVYANPRIAEILDFKPEEMVGKSVLDLVAEPDRALVTDNMRRRMAGEVPFVHYNFQALKKNGSGVPMEVHGSIMNYQGRPAIVATLLDITERKRAEAALQESEENFKALFQQAGDYALVLDPQADVRLMIVDANESACRAHGYSRDELIGKSVLDLDVREFSEEEAARMEEKIRAGETLHFETVHCRKDGSTFPIEVAAKAVQRAGKLPLIFSTERDITERKQAELQLRQNAEQMAILLKTHKALTKSLDLTQILQILTDSAAEILDGGTAAVYLLNEDALYLGATTPPLSPEVPDNLRRAFLADHPHIQKVINSGSVLVIPDAKTSDLTDAEREVCEMRGLRTIVFFPLIGSKGIMGVYIVSSIDAPRQFAESQINLCQTLGSQASIAIENARLYQSVQNELRERQKAEAALQESENRYRTVVENAGEGIVVTQEGFLKFTNPHFTDITGYSEEESKSQPFIEFVHPDDREPVMEIHNKRFKGEDVPSAYEFRAVDKQGNTIWLENNGILIEWDGKPASLNFLRDITDRKKAEEEKSRLLKAIETAKESISLTTPDGIIVYGNKAMDDLFGYEKGELLGQHVSVLTSGWGGETLVHEALTALEKEGLWEGEVLNKKKDGMEFITYATTSAIKDEKGNIINLIGTQHDITERKQAEEALREERDRAQNYLDVAGVMFVHINTDGNVTLINKKGLDILGYQEDEIVGKNWFDNFLPEQNKEIVKEVFYKLMAGEIESVEYYENPIVTKDGKERIIAWHNAILREEGKIVGTLSSGEDVTERKKSEAALAASEQKFRKFFENEPEYCFMVSPQGTILEANHAALNTLCYTLEELAGKPVSTIYAPESYRKMHQLIEQWEKTGEIRDEEMVIQTQNGDRRTVLLSATKVSDEDGKLLHSISIQRDITERKEAEEALQKSEERFRSIFENSIIGMYRTNPDGHILMANPALVHMLSYSCFDELAQRNLEQEGYSSQTPRSAFIELIETEGSVIGMEADWAKKDGTILSIRESARAVKDEHGNTLYYEGTVEDITESKQTKEALRAERDKLQALMDGINRAGISIDIIGTDYKVLFQNEVSMDSCGKLEGKKCYEGFMASDKPCEQCPAAKAIKENKAVETEQRGSEGSVYHVIAAPLPDADGNVNKAVELVFDVTEHKKAEEALRESEEKFRTITEQITEFIFVTDAQGGISYASPASTQIFGCTPEEMQGHHFTEFLAESDITNATTAFHNALATGVTARNLQLQMKRKDGTTFFGELNGSLYRQDNTATGTIGSIRDITERKQTELELEKRQYYLTKAQEMGKIGTWELDIEKNTLVWTDENYRIFGLDNGTELTYETFLNNVHHDDREYVDQKWTGALNAEPYDIEHRLIVNGKVKWVREKADIQFRDDGRPVLAIGFTQDITERKQAEEELKENEKRYRLLVESASDSIFLMDIEGNFIDANPATCDSQGRTWEELLSLSMSDIDPDWPSKKLKSFLRKMVTGEPVNIEGIHLRKNKTSFPVEISLTKVDLEERQVVLALARDITQRRRIEESLRRKAEIVTQEDKVHVSGMDIEWDHENGMCTFEKLPVLLLWRNTTLAALMSGVQKMVGAERFVLALQAEGRKSVEDDWRVISQFPDFNKGFEAIANIAAVAGWGNWKLVEIDTENKECLFRIWNSWEGLYQKSLGVSWGSGMLAGKLAGYCSMLFKDNCWADQTAFVAKGDEFDEFKVHTSERSIEKEIENLLFTDKATRADMAVALQNLRTEISMRKDVEKALRESEQHYRAIVEDQTELICRCLPDGTLTFVNEAYCRYFTKSRDELIGHKFMPLIPEEEHQKMKSHFASVGPGNPVATHEHHIIMPNGDIRWHQWTNRAILDDAGNIVEFQGVGRDITKQKLAEEELRESEKRFRSLSEAAFEGIAFTENGVLVDANEAFAKIYDYGLKDLKGSHVIELVAPEHRKVAMKNIRPGHEGISEHKGLRKDGSLIDLEIHSRDVEYQGRRMRLTAIRDITEHKLAEKRIKDYQAQLKSLASELSLAEERERRRIATGIHDDIAQKLAMAKFSLQSLQASVKDNNISVSLEKQCELMSQVVADARSLTFELGNPVLYQVGLEAAVESYLTERIQAEFGIECKFKLEGPKSSLDEDVRIVLFQAVRELLANVIKHANASTIEVCIRNNEYSIQIVVQDDGVGFNPKKIGPHTLSGGGFGLFNIRERLEYFGGKLEIESRLKRGTRVTMTIAVRADAMAGQKEVLP